MTTRCRMLVVGSTLTVLIGAAVLWFTVFRDQGEPTTAGQAKSTAELLIGSWEMVKSENPPLPEVVEIICTFTADGKFEIRAKDPINGLQMRTGTYRLEGNTLWFTAEPFARYRVRTWDITIESITQDHLVTLSRDPEFPDPLGSHQRSEYQRVPTK